MGGRGVAHGQIRQEPAGRPTRNSTAHSLNHKAVLHGLYQKTYPLSTLVTDCATCKKYYSVRAAPEGVQNVQKPSSASGGNLLPAASLSFRSCSRRPKGEAVSTSSPRPAVLNRGRNAQQRRRSPRGSGHVRSHPSFPPPLFVRYRLQRRFVKCCSVRNPSGGGGRGQGGKRLFLLTAHSLLLITLSGTKFIVLREASIVKVLLLLSTPLSVLLSSCLPPTPHPPNKSKDKALENQTSSAPFKTVALEMASEIGFNIRVEPTQPENIGKYQHT